MTVKQEVRLSEPWCQQDMTTGFENNKYPRWRSESILMNYLRDEVGLKSVKFTTNIQYEYERTKYMNKKNINRTFWTVVLGRRKKMPKKENVRSSLFCLGLINVSKTLNFISHDARLTSGGAVSVLPVCHLEETFKHDDDDVMTSYHVFHQWFEADF